MAKKKAATKTARNVRARKERKASASFRAADRASKAGRATAGEKYGPK